MNVHMKVFALTRNKSVKAPSVPVKMSVQYRASFNEWLIKEETVVFSGNRGWW